MACDNTATVVRELLVLAVIASCSSSAQLRTAASPVDLVTENVVLIDGTGAPARPGTSIAIDRGTIVGISTQPPPARTRVRRSVTA